MESDMIELKYNILSAKDWARLRASVNWTIHSQKDFSEAIENSLLIVSAHFDDEVIGMARLMGDNKFSFFIQDVIVLPDFQNQGIGTCLVNSLIEYIKLKASPKTVVNLMASKGNESFYEKLGFKKRDGKLKGYGMELIINPN